MKIIKEYETRLKECSIMYLTRFCFSYEYISIFMTVTDLIFQFSDGILMHSLFEEVMHRVTQLKAHGILGSPYSSSSFAKKLGGGDEQIFSGIALGQIWI